MRRLAARELHRHLALRLDGDGVIEQGLDVFPLNSCTKPTWLASMKHGSHIMLQRLVRSTVSTEPRPWVMVLEPCLCSVESLCARMSRPGKYVFQVLEERRVDGHHVFEMAVNRAILHHQDLAVALDHLGLDLARLVGVENVERGLAVQNLLPDFRNAARAQGIGIARPAQRRLGLLPRFQQRLVRPFGHKARILVDLVELIEYYPSRAGGVSHGFFNVFNRLVHLDNLS